MFPRWPVLTLLMSLACGCTVLNDMDGYSGGLAPRDTGAADSAVADSSAVDSAMPDTAAPPDTSVDDTLVDTAADTLADTSIIDSGTIDTGADVRDTTPDVVDTSVADSTMDTAVPDAPVGCHLVINEVQTRSVATGFDEFVEIYNPCDVEIAITGWKLVYRSASGATESVLVPSFAAGAKVAAKGFFLVGNAMGSYAATSDATYTSGVGDDAGIALRDAGGGIVDSVAWGAAVATHPFIETAAAPQPSSGGSIARKVLGIDTGDNSLDFAKVATPTPKSG